MNNAEFHRRRKKLSQQALSDLVRIGQPYISLLEQGRFLPTDDQRLRLAIALDIDPARLLDEVVPVENVHVG
jgi:transcriptional regulator with XRE-family HTH domain